MYDDSYDDGDFDRNEPDDFETMNQNEADDYRNEGDDEHADDGFDGEDDPSEGDDNADQFEPVEDQFLDGYMEDRMSGFDF